MASGVNGMTQVVSSAHGGTLQSVRQVIGVGCTSALVSTGRPRPERKSRAFISIRNGVGVGKSFSIVLKDGIRSRREEEDLVGKMVLQSILQAIKEGQEEEEEEEVLQVGEGILMSEDKISCAEWNCTPSINSAPLFLDKVRLLNPCIAPSVSSFGTKMTPASPRRTITFVIGTDTMVRILNQKYYGGEMDNRCNRKGVHFVVGGRVEQVVGGETDRKSSTFVMGEEALEGLPVDVKDIFTIIKEEDFRVDISNTELRARE